MAVAGERVQALVPAPLPPRPGLVVDEALQGKMEAAALAVGRLEGAAHGSADAAAVIRTLVREEAMLSSRIEGIRCSLLELLRFDLDGDAEEPADAAAAQTANCVAALDHGLRRMNEGVRLSNRLLREMHGELMQGPHGRTACPGEFRRVQNWIGGRRPSVAAFVPPPHGAVAGCMRTLERFVQRGGHGMPVLLRAGLAHAQFETIHPFVDGNGRVGRLLATCILLETGVLRRPLLPWSLRLAWRRPSYYQALRGVHQTGDWEAWLGYFLEAVEAAAAHAASVAARLVETFAGARARIAADAGRRTPTALRLYEALIVRPYLSIPAACRATGLAFQTADSAMDALAGCGIVREITGGRRNRRYVYDDLIAKAQDRTEPPADGGRRRAQRPPGAAAPRAGASGA